LYVSFYFVTEALWVLKGSSITLAVILGLVSKNFSRTFVIRLEDVRNFNRFYFDFYDSGPSVHWSQRTT
jgi:hypothetical protein